MESGVQLLAALKDRQFNCIYQGMRPIVEMPKDLIFVIQSFIDWIPTNERHNKERTCVHKTHLISNESSLCDLCGSLTIAFSLVDGQGVFIEKTMTTIDKHKNTSIEVNTNLGTRNIFVVCLYCSLSFCDSNKIDIKSFLYNILHYNHHYNRGQLPCNSSTPIYYLLALNRNYVYIRDKFTTSIGSNCNNYLEYAAEYKIKSNTKIISLVGFSCQLCGNSNSQYMLIDLEGGDRTCCSHFSSDWFVICYYCVPRFNGCTIANRGKTYYEFNGKCNCVDNIHSPIPNLKRLTEFIKYIQMLP